MGNEKQVQIGSKLQVLEELAAKLHIHGAREGWDVEGVIHVTLADLQRAESTLRKALLSTPEIQS